jgi:hypothetical protein
MRGGSGGNNAGQNETPSGNEAVNGGYGGGNEAGEEKKESGFPPAILN